VLWLACAALSTNTSLPVILVLSIVEIFGRQFSWRLRFLDFGPSADSSLGSADTRILVRRLNDILGRVGAWNFDSW